MTFIMINMDNEENANFNNGEDNEDRKGIARV